MFEIQYQVNNVFLADQFFRYLPISVSLSLLHHFKAWNLLSEQLHSDGHEQTTAVSVAAGGIYHQKHNHENDHDDANHAAFGHAAAHFKGKEKLELFQFHSVKEI